ncbi:MAG: protein kinase [Kofleriaceae bacterium]
MSCPDANALQAMIGGRVTMARREPIIEHLDGCAECREVLAALVRGQATVALAETSGVTARELDLGATHDHDTLAEAATTTARPMLGRYVLGPQLGAGAMGVVYRAEDPKLGRHVAIKLLRRPDPLLRDRLSREARAMARVSHPNVVAVFDVGTFEEQVYVAMELVRGRTLREWLSERPRSVREIVEMFAAAGRGLAAAHAAGVVHRDFKPDNVLIGEDGRPRVTDFGLAGSAAPRPPSAATTATPTQARTPTGPSPKARRTPTSPPAASAGPARQPSPTSSQPRTVPARQSTGAQALATTEAAGSDSTLDALAATVDSSTGSGGASVDSHDSHDSLALRLTRTGTTLGTPVYMSPEQFEGGNIDPRSDQWAYCVSLYEALYGARPFRGRTFDELADNVAAGTIPPGQSSRVTPALSAIVRRGLAVRPGDRHATMDALLAELGRDRAAPWRRASVLAGLVAAVFALGVLADWLLRQRAEETTTQFFRATGAQLERSVALRYQSFVALADASYSVPVMHQVLGHKDQADFGLGEQGEDTENLELVHASLASADWISWAERSSRATIAVGDYKGRLLLTSADPERWGSDLLVLPAVAEAFDAIRDAGGEDAPADGPHAQRSGGAMVARYDDPRVTAAQLYGPAPPPGLVVVFARALVVGGVPLGLFVQAIDGAQLLGEVSVGEDVLLSMVAPDGSAVGGVPAAVSAASAAAPRLGGEVRERRAGGQLYLTQARPLRGLEGRAAIATLVMARRIDPGLAGLFAGARVAFAVAALALLALALTAWWRARALSLA